jgi:hypothetical protein
MIRHIVLFRFRKGITDGEIENIFQKLGNLRGVIPTIQSFSWGKYENTDGYQYGFTMKFKDEKDRDAYLTNPYHECVAKEIVFPFLEDGFNSVIAFDYEKQYSKKSSLEDKLPEVLRYIVLFKPGNEEYEEKIAHFFEGLKDLSNQSSGVLSLSFGRYQSNEGLNQKYSHGLTMKFADELNRDSFLANAAYQKMILSEGEAFSVETFSYTKRTKNGGFYQAGSPQCVAFTQKFSGDLPEPPSSTSSFLLSSR